MRFYHKVTFWGLWSKARGALNSGLKWLWANRAAWRRKCGRVSSSPWGTSLSSPFTTFPLIQETLWGKATSNPGIRSYTSWTEGSLPSGQHRKTFYSKFRSSSGCLNQDATVLIGYRNTSHLQAAICLSRTLSFSYFCDPDSPSWTKRH